MLSRRVLSKEEETETTDAEVTKDDQDRINAFSRLYNRSKYLEEELEGKKKEKEDLEEISTELELADDDESVPYRIGDSFMSLPPPRARELLERAVAEVDDEVTTLEEQLGTMREEMDRLKGFLYARFGRGINLEG